MVDHIAFRLKPRIREGLLATGLARSCFCSTMRYHYGIMVCLSVLVCSPCLHAKTFFQLPGLSSQTSFSRTQRRQESHCHISHTFSIFFSYCNSTNSMTQIFNFSSRRVKAKMMPNLSFLSRTLWKNLSSQFRAGKETHGTTGCKGCNDT